MKIRLPEKQVAGLVAGVIKLLALTIRVRIDDPNGFLAGIPAGPFIAMTWHNRMLGLVIAGRHRPALVPMTVLTSASRDGGLLAEVMARFGLEAVRGSSSRGGSTALRQMMGVLQRGRTILITPDGPRGPCYQLSPGAVLLAAKSGAPVLPIHVSFSRSRRLRSWDRFFIPLPFSTITVQIDPGVTVAPPDSAEDFEITRQRVEQLLGGEP